MLVKDLMTTGISCVKEDAPLAQIARQMKQENVGVIPVCSDLGEVLGLITDRDLVLRALSRDTAGDPEDAPLLARDIMSTHIISVSPEMNTHEAALLLSKYQIRRLPVTRNHKLVGMLSLADIARKTVYVDEAGDALSAISAAAPLLH